MSSSTPPAPSPWPLLIRLGRAAQGMSPGQLAIRTGPIPAQWKVGRRDDWNRRFDNARVSWRCSRDPRHPLSVPIEESRRRARLCSTKSSTGEERMTTEQAPIGARAPLPPGQKYCTTCGNVLAQAADLPELWSAPAGGIVGLRHREEPHHCGHPGLPAGRLRCPQVLPGPDRDGDRLPAVLLTFVPAIVGFIEFIILLTISDDAFARKYGRPVTA